jgi:hypothetical protein
VPLDFASGLLGALSFQLSWRVGQEKRSVNILSTQIRHPNRGVRWDYFLEIPTDNNTCLTTELLLDVEMRERSNHVQLSAQLK